MRYLYSFLFYFAVPFILLRLLIRSLRLPAYRSRLAERFGYYSCNHKGCIWVHAVSVGETIAAIPLIKQLQQQFPNIPMVVTTMTPTGAERVKSAFGDKVRHVYIPYDLPGATKRFVKAMAPYVAIIMETELWPNLLAACQQNKTPICLVNARLSEKSAQGYQKISLITRKMLQQIDLIAAHGEVDAMRFKTLGAPEERMLVTGNIKFDLKVSDQTIAEGKSLRQQLGEDRFIWVAASTHDGEETMLLAAQQKLCKVRPDALLILVPRHPDRFDAIAKLCEQSHTVARRSLREAVDAKTSIYLGDTMGEMLIFYGAADVAFVGGSLIPRGGHNMLEPAALNKPILTGPHLFNFAEISELFVKADALIKVQDSESLAEQLMRFAEDPASRLAMGERAKKVMQANQGALQKQLDAIVAILKKTIPQQV